VESLLDRLVGRFQSSQVEEVESHLKSCARCRKEAASVERLFLAMTRDRAELPPEWVRNQVRSLVTARPKPVSLSGRQILSLRFDSWLAPAPSRRASGGTRRLLLGAPGLDIDLEIEAAPSGDTRVLRGQVLPHGKEAWTDVRAQLSRRGRRTSLARKSPRLGFRFEPLPSGTYKLLLVAGGREYLFPELGL
jgi:hypothetical protein